MATLVLLPTLFAEQTPNGDFRLTKKLISGFEEWARFWGGPVKAILQSTDQASDDIGHMTVRPNDLPIELVVVPKIDDSIIADLRGMEVVCGAADYRQVDIDHICRRAEIPFVQTTEYSFRTRLQMIRASGLNALRQARRSYNDWRLEKQYLRVITSAAGLQCNGTPTYDAYARLNDNTLLYYDTRVRPEQLITDDALAHRLTTLNEVRPLRLLFSGRLNRIKGANHLTPLARKLRERGVDFHLSICGDGECVSDIERDIARWDLHRYVTLEGSLDFDTELLPMVRERTDLFVCCHRQGDPSCTYLETFSCGVPIVGYDNEAFIGLLQRVDAGEAVQMDNLDGLADAILKVALRREGLKTWSKAALEFSREHTFDSTFERRVEHLHRSRERYDRYMRRAG